MHKIIFYLYFVSTVRGNEATKRKQKKMTNQHFYYGPCENLFNKRELAILPKGCTLVEYESLKKEEPSIFEGVKPLFEDSKPVSKSTIKKWLKSCDYAAISKNLEGYSLTKGGSPRLRLMANGEIMRDEVYEVATCLTDEEIFKYLYPNEGYEIVEGVFLFKNKGTSHIPFKGYINHIAKKRKMSMVSLDSNPFFVVNGKHHWFAVGCEPVEDETYIRKKMEAWGLPQKTAEKIMQYIDMKEVPFPSFMLKKTLFDI